MPVISGGGGLSIPFDIQGGSTEIHAYTGGTLGVSGPGGATVLITDTGANRIFTVDAATGITAGPLAAGHNGLFLSDHLDVLFFAVDESDRSLFAKGPASFGGDIFATSLPAADPHVVGQLYTVVGVLHVSAG